MECKFHVGQKVVCVDVSPCSHWKPNAWPLMVELGKKYTIRDIRLLRHGVVLTFEELDDRSPLDGAFHWRFRPLTDISVFEAMLTKKPSRKLVEVE